MGTVTGRTDMEKLGCVGREAAVVSSFEALHQRASSPPPSPQFLLGLRISIPGKRSNTEAKVYS